MASYWATCGELARATVGDLKAAVGSKALPGVGLAWLTRLHAAMRDAVATWLDARADGGGGGGGGGARAAAHAHFDCEGAHDCNPTCTSPRARRGALAAAERARLADARRPKNFSAYEARYGCAG